MADEREYPGQTLCSVVYLAGERYEALDDERGRLQDEHVAYQLKQQAAGLLALGGPHLGEVGGLAVFRTASRDEALALTAADPAVAGGLYRVEVREWRLVLGGPV